MKSSLSIVSNLFIAFFLQGFGKRRSKNNIRGEFDPLFVSWVPKHVDRKAFVDDVKISSYADDYNHDPTSPHVIAEVQSIGTERETNPPTPAPLETSVYSSVYKHGQPDHVQSKEIRRETFERFLTTRTRLHSKRAAQPKTHPPQADPSARPSKADLGSSPHRLKSPPTPHSAPA